MTGWCTSWSFSFVLGARILPVPDKIPRTMEVANTVAGVKYNESSSQLAKGKTNLWATETQGTQGEGVVKILNKSKTASLATLSFPKLISRHLSRQISTKQEHLQQLAHKERRMAKMRETQKIALSYMCRNHRLPKATPHATISAKNADRITIIGKEEVANWVKSSTTLGGVTPLYRGSGQTKGVKSSDEVVFDDIGNTSTVHNTLHNWSPGSWTPGLGDMTLGVFDLGGRSE